MASQRVLAQPRDIGRARPRRWPVEAAFAFLDGDIVDAGLAPPHQAVFVELPLLVAVGTIPLPGIVVPFILEAHGDAVLIERPEILDQAIVVLLRPFAGEEFDDRLAALEELGAVTPAAVLGVGQRHLDRIARIPGVFRHARLLGGSFAGEGRQRRTRHDISPRFAFPGDCTDWYRQSIRKDQSGARSAFINCRNDFGIGFARPSLMKATRTSALTSTSSTRRTSCASVIEAPFTATGHVTTSSTSSIRAGRMKSRCIERTTKAKPGVSSSACSNSACCDAPISRRWLVRPRSMKRK